MIASMTERALALRLCIMRSFALTGSPPSLAGEDPALVRELVDGHAIVLDDAGAVRMAHPFAAHTTGARVSADGRDWWGNCAWDGLGIVAAIGLSGAVVESNGVAVAADDPDPSVLFHVAVPARQWWDDIALACGTMLLFPSADAIDAWCNECGRARGGVMTADTLAALAARWYGSRLDPGWRPHPLAERQGVLDSFGLTGPFWQLG
jgi:hypothetical protein